MSGSIVVDVNLLLRHILNDDKEQAAASRRFLEHAARQGKRLLVLELAIAEAAWVLTGRGWSHQDIAEALLALSADDRFELRDRPIVQHALRLYAEQNVDWIDAYQAVYAVENRAEGVASFDSDYEKLGVKRIEPK